MDLNIDANSDNAETSNNNQNPHQKSDNYQKKPDQMDANPMKQGSHEDDESDQEDDPSISDEDLNANTTGYLIPHSASSIVNDVVPHQTFVSSVNPDDRLESNFNLNDDELESNINSYKFGDNRDEPNIKSGEECEDEVKINTNTIFLSNDGGVRSNTNIIQTSDDDGVSIINIPQHDENLILPNSSSFHPGDDLTEVIISSTTSHNESFQSDVRASTLFREPQPTTNLPNSAEDLAQVIINMPIFNNEPIQENNYALILIRAVLFSTFFSIFSVFMEAKKCICSLCNLCVINPSYPETDMKTVVPSNKTDTQRNNVRHVNFKRPEKQIVTAIAPCKIDDSTYNMNHQRMGDVVIFNNENFLPSTKQEKRDGTKVDCKLLKYCFKVYGFKVHIYKDKTFAQIDEITTKWAKKVHSKSNVFVMVFLTHGNEQYIFAKDEKYRLQRMISKFTADKCPSLAGKPKLVFVNACRGKKFDQGIALVPHGLVPKYGTQVDTIRVETAYDQTDGFPKGTYKQSVEADFCIIYSTSHGYYSFRNPGTGSIFIRILCEEWLKDDIVNFKEMVVVVKRRVTTEYESNISDDEEAHEKKQMPQEHCSLIRSLYFKKNKNLTNSNFN